MSNTKERTDKLELFGIVEEVLPSTLFNVKVEGSTVLCTLSGKMRQNNIRVILGDSVKIEVSVYDLTRGRIVHRK